MAKTAHPSIIKYSNDQAERFAQVRRHRGPNRPKFETFGLSNPDDITKMENANAYRDMYDLGLKDSDHAPMWSGSNPRLIDEINERRWLEKQLAETYDQIDKILAE